MARFRAGVARQNARIVQLERANAPLRTEVQEAQALLAALQEQNALLLQQVATLQAENDRLRGIERHEAHGEHEAPLTTGVQEFGIKTPKGIA